MYHQALGIKERELSNLTDYLTNLGTQSAFMFGFGVGMFSVEIPDDTPKYLSFLYYGFATICLGAEVSARGSFTQTIAPDRECHDRPHSCFVQPHAFFASLQ